MSMTLERAVTLATGTDNGELNPLWREVVETLVAEVQKNDNLAAMEEKNEPQGPLPALILAGELDLLADEMTDKAMEIEIFNLSHAHHADELRGAAKQVLQWAKETREDANE